MPTLSFYNEGVYNDGIYNLTSSGVQAAISLDGKRQYLGRADTVSLAIANTWTIGFWSKPFANKEHTTVFSTASSSNENRIDVLTTPVSKETNLLGKRPSELRVMLKDADGTTIKHYTWPDWYKDEVWTHTFLQWNGVDLDALRNGVATTTGIAFVNATGTMSDTPDRKIFYGSAVAGIFATWSGIVGHFGMWDTILGANEMNTIVSGTFEIDLTGAAGDYVSTANLQHYWRPGFNSGNIGEDFAGSLNLNKLRNLDETSITTDTPT